MKDDHNRFDHQKQVSALLSLILHSHSFGQGDGHCRFHMKHKKLQKKADKTETE